MANSFTPAVRLWFFGFLSFGSGLVILAEPSLANGLVTIPAKTTAQELLEDARQRLVNPNHPPSEPIRNDPFFTPPTASPSTVSDPRFFFPDAPVSDSSSINFDAYRLGPGDSFFVNVEGFPEASFQATLDLEGNVLIPIVGIRSLQGMTLNEAKALLQDQLNRFFVEPVVDLTLVARRPVSVTLLGEVVRPGFYPLGDPQLATAILTAGGVTRLANLTTVQIRRTVRDRTGQTVQVLEQNVDLFHPLAQGQNLPNVRLEDGDVIIIPALTATEAAAYDRALIAQSNLAQPVITVRVLSYPTRIGNLSLPNGSTFLDAVTILSPIQSEANIRKIGVIRFDPAAEQVVTIELDAKAALLGDMSQNIVLENNDVLVINRTLLNRITAYLNTFTQPFRDILGFLLFFDTLGSSADNLFGPSSSNN